jgi:5'-nucleotidase
MFDRIMNQRSRAIHPISLLRLISIAVVVSFLVAPAGVSAAPAGSVSIQLLAINDFHGNIQPPSGSSGRILTANGNVDAGGVEYLATHLKQLEATNPNTLVVGAGDLIGASPLISGLFHDEPTIEAMNALGLDLSSVGNHEFDEGSAELLRMQNGGCHPVDGCQDGDPFYGADFQYLAANVVRTDNHKTLFPAYKIRSFGTAKVAFVGLVLKGTPTIVTPAGVAGLEFKDEADTVNALVPELQAKGVHAVVVLIHEGGIQTGLYNDCTNLSGAIVDIVHRMDPEVDVVISGHTHQAYNCMIDNKIVTSASSFGRIITKIDLQVDRNTGNVLAKQAQNLIVTRDVAKDVTETAIISKYNALSAPLANKVIGSITADLTRIASPAGEQPLGDVIADAQLASTAPAGFGGAVVAFMNPGGIRADFTYSQISGGEASGQVTYSEAFTVQPFANTLTTISLTGAQIKDVLEQQFDNPAAGQLRFLQVSNGFAYTWSASAPHGSHVDATSIKINGVTVDPSATYRVTVNNFLAGGGDNFTVLKLGTNPLGGAVDIDSLVDYFGVNSPIAPPPLDRITQVP